MSAPLDGLTIHQGDALAVLKGLPDDSVNCCVTSPPYWGLRDYKDENQLGLEDTPEKYVRNLVRVFREVRRVLRDDGTFWLVIGDTYSAGSAWTDEDDKRLRERFKGQTAEHKPGRGSKIKPHRSPNLPPKNLVGIPWKVAFALQADAWYLRAEVIWSKPNCMPESISDRPTRSHENIFLLTSSRKYEYNADLIRELLAEDSLARALRERHGGKYQDADPAEHGNIKKGANYGKGGDPEKIAPSGGRNKRSVWEVATQAFPDAHFATFPPKLIEPCILAGCPQGGTVLDPFMGSGTTGIVSLNNKRKFIGIELNPEYVAMAEKRIAKETSQLSMWAPDETL